MGYGIRQESSAVDYGVNRNDLLVCSSCRDESASGPSRWPPHCRFRLDDHHSPLLSCLVSFPVLSPPSQSMFFCMFFFRKLTLALKVGHLTLLIRSTTPHLSSKDSSLSFIDDFSLFCPVSRPISQSNFPWLPIGTSSLLRPKANIL